MIAALIFAGIALLTVCLYAVILRSQLSYVKLRNAQLERNVLALSVLEDEFVGVAWSFRDIFDHLADHVEMDAKLSELLFNVSNYIASNAADTANALLSWNGAGSGPRMRDDYVLDIDKLVAEINDPVLITLWKSRSLRDCSEMLRHGFFLAFGYPSAVVSSSLAGINVTWPAGHKMPQYTEGHAIFDERMLGRMWQRWRRVGLEGASGDDTAD